MELFPHSQITQYSEKCTERVVRQVWVPFMSLTIPFMPVASLLRLLSNPLPLEKNGVLQNSFQVSTGLEIPHTPRMGWISEGCSCLFFSTRPPFLSGCEPLMEVIDGFSRWRSSPASLREGGFSSLREGGFSFWVCRHHPVKEKRTRKESLAFQAGMQELEEGFVGDKSKKIV